MQATSPSKDLSEKVKTYYDNNTPIFIKVGRSKESKNIHRAVWGTGVRTSEEAMTFTNKLILDEILSYQPQNEVKILDLGCGVGAPLFYLAERYPNEATFTGVSISEVQINIANELKSKVENGKNCSFIEADFHKLPELPAQDLIYMIEAFIHSNDPGALLSQVSKNLKSGGKFIICDDTLSNSKSGLSEKREKKILNDYIENWQVGSLYTDDQITNMASDHNLKLISNQNLTPNLNLWTARDKFAHASLFIYNLLPFTSTYWESIKGGDALQIGLLKGLFEYRFMVFEKM
ncbi:methyltransferase domain-containing protein [Fulvivirgaceae bacterium BMA10]|uniref:Methyltransferase domain-containing protein n=1 Tax=Splendidivirga corallicola TaxID=3051826 RepID=A0ABT8KPH5_9BACT|nr:methyltransferase domain-containing protein [Fulvivirgaceae bacterium BMA10]